MTQHAALSFRPGMSNDDILRAGSLAWARADFLEALFSLGPLVQSTTKEDEDFLSEQLGSRERREDLVFGDLPAQDLRILQWFDERYRSYPSRVAATLHLRFRWILAFIGTHQDELLMDELMFADEGGISFDNCLIDALGVMPADFFAAMSRGRLFPPLPDYDAVMLMIDRIENGEVLPAAPMPRGNEPFDDGPKIGVRELEEALAVIAEYRANTANAQRYLSEAFRQMPADARRAIEAVGDQEDQYLLLHLHEIARGDSEDLLAKYGRVQVASSFLDQHMNQLVRDGYATRRHGGHVELTHPLLEMLAAVGLDTGEKGVRVPEYHEVANSLHALQVARRAKRMQAEIDGDFPEMESQDPFAATADAVVEFANAVQRQDWHSAIRSLESELASMPVTQRRASLLSALSSIHGDFGKRPALELFSRIRISSSPIRDLLRPRDSGRLAAMTREVTERIRRNPTDPCMDIFDAYAAMQ